MEKDVRAEEIHKFAEQERSSLQAAGGQGEASPEQNFCDKKLLAPTSAAFRCEHCLRQLKSQERMQRFQHHCSTEMQLVITTGSNPSEGLEGLPSHCKANPANGCSGDTSFLFEGRPTGFLHQQQLFTGN